MIKRFKNYIHNADEFEENNKDITERIVQQKINYKKNQNEKQNKKNNKQQENKSIEYKFCDICKKKLFSNKDFEIHMTSKKHEKNMKILTINEIKNCGSIKKYLIIKKLISPLKKSNLNKVRYMLYSFALHKMFKKLPIKNK
jgi:hypothetical protein